ncbi:MAG: extracellular solute-binding protein [Bacteroidaceae bacterium]|nr:extracellular solute-binding protein [Bacteroidaceae bacterium]
MYNHIKKFTAILLTVLSCTFAYPLNISAEADTNLNLPETVYADGSYGAYNKANEAIGVEPADAKLNIKAADFANQDAADVTVRDYVGKSDVLFWNSMEGSVTWNVDIPKTGLYEIFLNYCPIEGKGASIDLGIKLDGKYPFNEAESTTFCRTWKDDSGMKMDDQGNEYTPDVSEVFSWSSDCFRDVKGYYGNAPYSFYLTQGAHTLTLACNNESVALDEITFSNVEKAASYADVASEYEKKGYKNSNEEITYIQAETPYQKSDRNLRAQYDRNSPLTQPFDASHIRYNCIGANAWKYQSQWISWEIDVPEDGLYNLGARYRQETIKGFQSSRRLTIDGKLPFAEAESIGFAYTENWDLFLFGKNDEPYLFYLTQGKHILKLEVVMGDVSSIVESLQNVNDNLMKLYHRIVMLTSTSPDPYRNYSIAESIPDMISILEESERTLETENKSLETITGNKSISTTTIQTLLSQIKGIIETPDSLITSARLNSFTSNISSLSSWLLDLKYQPITIDYLILKAPDDKIPRYNANLFENIFSGVQNFIASFVQDYSTAGKDGNGENITIWLSVGRDQMQIIKNIVSDSFTPETGIHVDIKLVSASLIQAILANKGPDISIMTARTEPVNLAIRNALVDLSELDGFDEVKDRFIDTALVPYQFQGGCYGIPDSLTYNMMFYRTDIFAEMGLKCPQTWDELLELAPILQRNGMKIGLSDPTSTFATFLMQRGVAFYNEELTDTNLDTSEAYDAFKQWTDYYTLHNFPQVYNFYSLFRTGELPLGIATYNMYNTLKVAAPEIDGLWKMVPVPGTVREDGTINRTSSASGTASIIFKQTKKLDASWKFIKWWTSDNVQSRYALDMESTLGLSARQCPANIKTMESITWTKDQLSALKEQMFSINELPEIPGSYYVTRNIENAFNDTVVGGKNARESLSKWSKEITIELERKRNEFGLEG